VCVSFFFMFLLVRGLRDLALRAFSLMRDPRELQIIAVFASTGSENTIACAAAHVLNVFWQCFSRDSAGSMFVFAVCKIFVFFHIVRRGRFCDRHRFGCFCSLRAFSLLRDRREL
jgi:hypothetical protein